VNNLRALYNQLDSDGQKLTKKLHVITIQQLMFNKKYIFYLINLEKT